MMNIAMDSLCTAGSNDAKNEPKFGRGQQFPKIWNFCCVTLFYFASQHHEVGFKPLNLV